MEPEYQPVEVQTGLIAYKWKALATVGLGVFLITMDYSITNISFPVLTKVFKIGITTVIWVALTYSLVSTSLLLILGRIGDLIGRKKIFASGMAFFIICLLLCSIAQSIGQLILFRALQGIGTAMALACGTAIITESFPPEERGKGIGIVGISVSIGLIVGPVIGGFLLQWFDWRSIYYMRVPVAIIALLMATTLLKKDPPRTEKRIRIDFSGALTSSFGIACIIFGTSQFKRLGPKSMLVYLFISIGLLCLIAFVLIERRTEEPVVDLSLFKNRAFFCGIWSIFLIFLAFPIFTLIMPFYLIEGMGLSSSAAGMLMAVPPVGAIIFSPLSGWLSDRYGHVWFSVLGVVIYIITFLLMHGFDLQSQIIALVPVAFLFGAADGTFQPANLSKIMGTVPKPRLGTASALIALYRQVGMALGIAITGTVFAVKSVTYQESLESQGMEAGYAARSAIPLAFHDILIIAIVVLIIVLILTLIPSKKSKV